MLFLQDQTAPELGKITAGAIDQAGKHASEAGPLTYFWFVVALVTASLCVYFFFKADKATTERNKACDDAVAAAKIEYAKERAVDNGNWASQVSELKNEKRDLLDRFERINQELRQHEGKSIEVLGGLRHALTQVHQLLAVVDQRLTQIEAHLNGGTRRPTTPFTPSPIPGLTPDILQP